MTTYKTYQEAKLAQPEETIWCNTKSQYGLFKTLKYSIYDMNPCDPKDYCMTVEGFLAAGCKFVKGDVVLSEGGGVIPLNARGADIWNKRAYGNSNIYVLKAKALESKTRTKVEYVLAEFNSDKERAEAFLEGNLYRYSSGEVTGSVEEDTYPLEKLADMFIGVGIFRRIETEMSEKGEYLDWFDATRKELGSPKKFAEFLYDNGYRVIE